MANESKDKKKKMPTALKRKIQSDKKKELNKAFKSKMRSSIRQFEESFTKEDNNFTNEKLKSAYSLLDKAVKRGVLKLNTASRKKARLAAQAKRAFSA